MATTPGPSDSTGRKTPIKKPVIPKPPVKAIKKPQQPNPDVRGGGTLPK